MWLWRRPLSSSRWQTPLMNETGGASQLDFKGWERLRPAHRISVSRETRWGSQHCDDCWCHIYTWQAVEILSMTLDVLILGTIPRIHKVEPVIDGEVPEGLWQSCDHVVAPLAIADDQSTIDDDGSWYLAIKLKWLPRLISSQGWGMSCHCPLVCAEEPLVKTNPAATIVLPFRYTLLPISTVCSILWE